MSYFSGMNLKIATQHVHFEEVAHAFTKVTGKKSIYERVPLEVFLDNYVTEEASSASQVSSSQPGVLTWKKSFTGFFNLFINSGGKNPVISRDYVLLDKVRI
jgi:hypothetical protein